MQLSSKLFVRSLRNGVPKRSLNLEAIERAVGIQAANHFIKSMEQNTNIIVRYVAQA